MLKIISNIMAIITCSCSFILLYMGAAFGFGIEKTILFNIFVAIFDFSLMLGLIFYAIYYFIKKNIIAAVPFLILLILFITGIIILKSIHLHSNLILYLFDAAVIIFYFINFYISKNKE